MKLTIKNQDLQDLLSSAMAVSKSTSAIKLIAERIGEDAEASPDSDGRAPEAGQLRVIAYNEMMVSEWLRPAEISRNGTIAIQPEGLDRLVKASRGADATFTLDTEGATNAKSLSIRTSKSSHEFPAAPAAVFDTLTPGRLEGAQASLGNLAKAITTARIAVAAKGDAVGARIAMTGVHIRKVDDKIHVVGTDGKRLALSELDNQHLGSLDLGPEGQITIPSEGIALAIDMLSSSTARMAVIDKDIIIQNEKGSLSIRMVAAPYPDYTRVLGHPTEYAIEISKGDFEMALQRSSAALARDKRNVSVKMTGGDEGLYLTSSASGQSSSECMSAQATETFAIGYDANYMLAAIGAFGKEDVSVSFANDQIPILVRANARPGITMMVMPCKVA